MPLESLQHAGQPLVQIAVDTEEVDTEREGEWGEWVNLQG